jgi:site-specific DNA recombinase
MRAALYPRVSTEEQFKEGYSIDAQLDKMRAFCFSQGWTIYQEYVEEGKSGKDLDRPQMKKLLSELEQFDVVVVYKLDRISRSVSDINYLLETFEKNKVSFRSVTEPYDTTTSQGKLLVNIFASLAQFEREQIAERVKFALDRKVEGGERAGSPAPFGYDLDKGKLIINKEEAEWVKIIFNESRYKGKRSVCELLNSSGVKSKNGNYWNDSMVTYLIENPVYCGYLRWNYREIVGKKQTKGDSPMMIKGTHESIIEEQLFHEVQSAKKNRTRLHLKSTTDYPFSGIARCSRCGYAITGVTKNGKRIYRCVGRFKMKICDMPPVWESALEQELLQLFNDFDVLEKNPKTENKKDVEKLQSDLKKIRTRLERTKELYMDGELDKKKYKEKLTKDKEKENEIIQSLNEIDFKFDHVQFKNHLNNLSRTWDKFTYDEKKKAIQSILDYVIVDVTKMARVSGDKQEIKVIEVNYK